MPSSPKRICHRCGKAVKGRCPCLPVRTETRTKQEQHRRNVLYGRRWKTFARAYLAHHPLCSDCETIQQARPATEVHHIEKVKDAPQRQYDKANLMPLCKHHHDTRTARGE